MAAQEETILLHFDIDEQPAVQSIKDLRQANSQLRAERDKVNISTKEGKELVDKLNVAIDKNNKVIKDNSSALEKQRQNVGNYSKSIQEAAGNLNVMGTNVGGLSAKLTSFANPATAAVAIVGALGAAYARSTIGAKDLEFAQNQLAFATTFLTDKFAGLISSSEDGEGAISKLTSFIIASFDTTTAVISKVAAMAAEELQQVQRDQQLAQVAINERLSENSELLTEISNTETTIAQKKQFAQKIEDNIVQNTNERLALINREIAATEKLIIDAEDKEFMLNKLFAERSNIQRQETKQLEKIEKQLNGIVNAENNRLAVQKDQARQEKEKADAQLKAIKDAEKAKDRESKMIARDLGPQGSTNQKLELKTVQQTEEQKREAYIQSANLKMMLDSEMAASAIEQLNASTSFALEAFGEQSAIFKFLASSETLISTYSSAQKSYDALAGIPFVGPALGSAAAAIAIASGLARVAAINSIDVSAAGGGDFVTTKPTMLLVGDNPGGRERVTVEPLSGRGKTQINPRSGLLQMAGGGSLTVNDGGFIANSNTNQIQQSMFLANLMKNLPPVIASWAEGRAVGRKLEFKENVSRR